MSSTSQFDPDATLNLSGNSDFSTLVLDLSVVDETDTGFKPWDAGVYPARLETAELGTSKKGNPMITWGFEMSNPKTGDTRKIRHYSTFSDATLPRLKADLMVLGPELDLSKFHAENDPPKLVGWVGMLRIGVQKRQDNGQMANRVEQVLPQQDESLSFLEELS